MLAVKHFQDCRYAERTPTPKTTRRHRRERDSRRQDFDGRGRGRYGRFGQGQGRSVARPKGRGSSARGADTGAQGRNREEGRRETLGKVKLELPLLHQR